MALDKTDAVHESRELDEVHCVYEMIIDALEGTEWSISEQLAIITLDSGSTYRITVKPE